MSNFEAKKRKIIKKKETIDLYNTFLKMGERERFLLGRSPRKKLIYKTHKTGVLLRIKSLEREVAELEK